MRIERDAYGVPSVYGDRDADVAFGLARAHAQDDFPTIQRQLLAGRGRLAATDGRDGARLDWFGKVTYAAETAKAGYGGLADETQALLGGYVRGLNAYAADHPGEVLDRSLFPVTEPDVVTSFVLLSPLFFGLDRVVGAIRAGEPLPDRAAHAHERGSNAFAFAPSRTADGSTLLVSNSHQPWQGPAAWYEARVSSAEGWRFAGALFPGSPTPLTGYNAHLGWANTINRPDLIDVYELTLDGTGERYRLDGAWRELDCERFWLRVRVGPVVLPVPQRRCRSEHGPVLVTDDGAYAIRYAGMDEARQVEQYYRMTRASSLDEWSDAMRLRAIPSINFAYADARGNVGVLYNAGLPVRRIGPDWTDVLPGDDGSLIWRDLVPFERLPFLLDPPSGYVVSANATPFRGTSPEHDLHASDHAGLVGVETRLTNRIERAVDLIEAHGEGARLTRAQVDAVKYDKGYSRRGRLGREVAAIATLRSDDPSVVEAAALLGRWDRTLDGEGPADALAALVVRDVHRTLRLGEPSLDPEAVLRDAAGFLREHHGRLDPPLQELLRLRRGTVDLPLTGGPDALRAIGWEEEEDGTLVADFGDSFVLYVRWPAGGGDPVGEAVSPYGAAVSRPGSPHHADQAPLFAAERLRPAPLPGAP